MSQIILTQKGLDLVVLVNRTLQAVHNYATELLLHSANEKEMALEDHTLLLKS